MLQFFSENWGNLLVIAIVAAAVTGAALNLRKRKKSGCSCGCGGCPSSDICHPKK